MTLEVEVTLDYATGENRLARENQARRDGDSNPAPRACARGVFAREVSVSCATGRFNPGGTSVCGTLSICSRCNRTLRHPGVAQEIGKGLLRKELSV